MKILKIILSVLFVIGVVAKAVTLMTKVTSKKETTKELSQLEKDIFDVILKSQPKEMISARPMRLEDGGNAITLYCEYLGEKSQEARETVRKSLYTELKNWNQTQPRKFEYIYLKFTDEAVSPPPQKQ